jgi:predicted nucleic acid-binding protein
MSVLVDTPLWSKYARKKNVKKNESIIDELDSLLETGDAFIIGAVRQELLSGISDKNQYNTLKLRMSFIPNSVTLDEDYITAAEYSNECRRNGVQGSTTDFLICAVAMRNKWSIWTEDGDFSLYRQYIPIRLMVNPAGVRRTASAPLSGLESINKPVYYLCS